MKTSLLLAAVCVIEICSTGCQYDNGGVNAGVAAGGAGGSAAPARPPRPDAATPGNSGSGGTGGSGGGSSVTGMPSPRPDAAPPTPDSALQPNPDPVAPPPDAAPVTPDAASIPVDAPPVTNPDSFCPGTPDLAVCLRFESGLEDESPNRLPVRGTRVRFERGRMGGMALDADRAEVEIPERPALDSAAITIEAWVNARSLGPRRTAIIDNPGQYGLVVLPSGSVMCSGRGGYALRAGALTPGRWTHLGCTFDATSVTLWIDGEMALQRPAGPVATEYQRGVQIGWEQDMGSGSFEGLIDNLRIWRVARRPDPGR